MNSSCHVAALLVVLSFCVVGGIRAETLQEVLEEQFTRVDPDLSPETTPAETPQVGANDAAAAATRALPASIVPEVPKKKPESSLKETQKKSCTCDETARRKDQISESLTSSADKSAKVVTLVIPDDSEEILDTSLEATDSKPVKTQRKESSKEKMNKKQMGAPRKDKEEDARESGAILESNTTDEAAQRSIDEKAEEIESKGERQKESSLNNRGQGKAKAVLKKSSKGDESRKREKRETKKSGCGKNGKTKRSAEKSKKYNKSKKNKSRK